MLDVKFHVAGHAGSPEIADNLLGSSALPHVCVGARVVKFMQYIFLQLGVLGNGHPERSVSVSDQNPSDSTNSPYRDLRRSKSWVRYDCKIWSNSGGVSTWLVAARGCCCAAAGGRAALCSVLGVCATVGAAPVGCAAVGGVSVSYSSDTGSTAASAPSRTVVARQARLG